MLVTRARTPSTPTPPVSRPRGGEPRPGSLGYELEIRRRLHHIRRLEMSLSSLYAIAASRESRPPRALRLCIADFERRLDEAQREHSEAIEAAARGERPRQRQPRRRTVSPAA
jgi:hypothetical protein